jgi:hypothetical protein
MYHIRKVGVLSVAKIMGLVYGLMSLLFLPFFFLILSGLTMSEAEKAVPGIGALWMMALVMPLMYAAAGFVSGALLAFFYNLIAGWVGGIELDLQPIQANAAPATSAAP